MISREEREENEVEMGLFAAKPSLGRNAEVAWPNQLIHFISFALFARPLSKTESPESPNQSILTRRPGIKGLFCALFPLFISIRPRIGRWARS
jgi:hypothetical protein